MRYQKNVKLNCNGGEEVPPGGWRGGEEVPPGGWRTKVKAI